MPLTDEQRQEMYNRLTISPEMQADLDDRRQRKEALADFGDLLSGTFTATGAGYGYQRDTKPYDRLREQALSEWADTRNNKLKTGTMLNQLDKELAESDRADITANAQAGHLNELAKQKKIENENLQGKLNAELEGLNLKNESDKRNLNPNAGGANAYRDFLKKYGVSLNGQETFSELEKLSKDVLNAYGTDAQATLQAMKAKETKVNQGAIAGLKGGDHVAPGDVTKLKDHIITGVPLLKSIQELADITEKGGVDSIESLARTNPVAYSKYVSVLLQLKNKYQLGALTGMDEKLLSGRLGGDPRNVIEAFLKLGHRGGVAGAIRDAAKELKHQLRAAISVNKYVPDPTMDDYSVVAPIFEDDNQPWTSGNSSTGNTPPGTSGIPVFDPNKYRK